MQLILNVKTLNSRKQIFCPECESTSFVKINLRKNFIFEFYSFIYYCRSKGRLYSPVRIGNKKLEKISQFLKVATLLDVTLLDVIY